MTVECSSLEILRTGFSNSAAPPREMWIDSVSSWLNRYSAGSVLTVGCLSSLQQGHRIWNAVGALPPVRPRSARRSSSTESDLGERSRCSPYRARPGCSVGLVVSCRIRIPVEDLLACNGWGTCRSCSTRCRGPMVFAGSRVVTTANADHASLRRVVGERPRPRRDGACCARIVVLEFGGAIFQAPIATTCPRPSSTTVTSGPPTPVKSARSEPGARALQPAATAILDRTDQRRRVREYNTAADRNRSKSRITRVHGHRCSEGSCMYCAASAS